MIRNMEQECGEVLHTGSVSEGHDAVRNEGI